MLRYYRALDEIADWLDDRGVSLPDAVKRRDRLEPGRQRKELVEDKLTAAFLRRFRMQRRRIAEALDRILPTRKAIGPDEWIAQIPSDVYTDIKTEAYILQLLIAAAEDGIDLFAANIAIGVDWTMANTQAAAWATKYTSKLLRGLDETTAKALRSALRAFAEQPGFTIGDVAKLLPLDERRALRIAITEITNVYAEAELLAGLELKKQFPDVRIVKTWMTNNDDLVCFPAWTMVKTDKGDVPIQNIRAGDRVLTRKGYCNVIATSKRRYNGYMVELTADKYKLIATEGHPIWKSKKGWLEIGKFDIGDGVELADQNVATVRSIFKFIVGNVHDMPSMSQQISVFFRVPIFAYAMPINTIDFESDPQSGQQKINGVSPHFGLLNKFNIEISKNNSYLFFGQCFPSKFAIASKTTKSPVRISGTYSKFFSAISTNNIVRRATAFFRTKARFPSSLVGTKDSSTLFANTISRIRSSIAAFLATYGIAIGNASIDGKLFAAYWANLRHLLNRIKVAFTATEAPPLYYLGIGLVGFLAASGASSHLARLSRGMITLGRAIDIFTPRLLGALKRLAADIAGVGIRHLAPSLSMLSLLYHEAVSTEINVYNLEVEDMPEFYANGILVHNCPICRPLNGQVVEVDGEFSSEFLLMGISRPAAHTGCRCWLSTRTDIGGEL